MHFTLNVATVTLAASFLLSGVAGSQLADRTLGGYGGGGYGGSTDVCGNVDSVLKVPKKGSYGYGQQYTNVGTIKYCLCVSDIPYFITTNSVAVKAVALAGRDYVTSALRDMINGCSGHQTCHYPPHAVPSCQSYNPCGFDCKDGYTPYPSYNPNQCVCKKPNKECNGKCGNYYACPSHYPKRDEPQQEYVGQRYQCRVGLTACGILGRGAGSWECLDTKQDLESCGGCAIPLPGDAYSPVGEDCTALQGVSDVSCIGGRCVVHRCQPGYEIHQSGSSCE